MCGFVIGVDPAQMRDTKCEGSGLLVATSAESWSEQL
jgi:hypothetical protein